MVVRLLQRLPPALTPLARWLAAALSLLLWAALPLQAQELQAVPPLSARVIDLTATLSAAQRQALENKLARFEQEQGTQIVVLMLRTTLPEDLAAYAHRVADTWKIGRREIGDGLLMVIAKDDRRVRIEVAKTLEGAIPDLAASLIIQETIRPAFRAGDFAGGIDAALNQLMTLVRGEGLPAPRGDPGAAGAGHQDGWDWTDLAIFLFVGVPVIGAVLTAVLGRKLGATATGLGAGSMGAWLTGSTGLGIAAGVLALLLILMMGFGSTRSRRRAALYAPPIIWGGGGGGWGGGSFGGGGFSSGGGGDFGGGGASGDW